MRHTTLAVLFLVAASGFAQQLSETVNVEVIQVPVYVIGPDGKSIRGLKKDAFSLLIDGFPKPIEYFDPVDVTEKTDEPRPEKERRLYLLLFDLTCAADDCRGLPGRIARAQKAASAAVGKSNLDTDLFAVATYSTNRGLQFATPFIKDRAAVRRAINTLAVSTLRDPLGLGISQGERTSWMREETTDITDQVNAMLNTGPDVASQEIASTMIGGVANQDNIREPFKQVIEDQFDNFGVLAARLAALEGQKHVIFFSQGFDSSLIQGPRRNPTINGPTAFDNRMMSRLTRMFEAFQSAGVFLDAVDIIGLRLDPQTSFSHESLQMLAHGTGGDFVKNSNDFSGAITDLTRRQEVFYLLGFGRHDLQRGKISVKVRGVPRGSHLVYRQGFGGPPEQKDVDPLMLADIIVNDLPQTGVSVSMGLSGPSLLVAISRKEVLPQLVLRSPWVETILYVFDKDGAAVVARQKRIEFDEATRAADGPIVITQKLDLPAGDYVAKTVTRIGGTNSVGFARMEFKVQ